MKNFTHQPVAPSEDTSSQCEKNLAAEIGSGDDLPVTDVYCFAEIGFSTERAAGYEIPKDGFQLIYT